MRILALATVLLVTGPAFGQDEAEKLYRAMEKKIASAKTIEVAFEAEMRMSPTTVKLIGKFYFAEDAKDAKVNSTMEGTIDRGDMKSITDMKFITIADGKFNYSKEGNNPPQTDPADAKII